MNEQNRTERVEVLVKLSNTLNSVHGAIEEALTDVAASNALPLDHSVCKAMKHISVSITSILSEVQNEINPRPQTEEPFHPLAHYEPAEDKRSWKQRAMDNFQE